MRTGKEIFESYLADLYDKLADEDEPREKPTEAKAQREYSDYIYEKFASELDGEQLDDIEEEAGQAFDFERVLAQYR